MIVAFDVDGTLIDDEDQPRRHVIALLEAFVDVGADVLVWSGGGFDYARHWVRRLWLEGVTVAEKGSVRVDLAVDDEIVDLGVVNLKVSREKP